MAAIDAVDLRERFLGGMSYAACTVNIVTNGRARRTGGRNGVGDVVRFG